MNDDQERKRNQNAYRQLRELIERTYVAGRFVAIAGGKIVADANDFNELRAILRSLGKDPHDVLIIQAGADYPESTVFLAQPNLDPSMYEGLEPQISNEEFQRRLQQKGTTYTTAEVLAHLETL